MGSRLRETLRRLWTSWWSRRRALAMRTEHDRHGGSRVDARARFWAEFREGQREAEAHSSKLSWKSGA